MDTVLDNDLKCCVWLKKSLNRFLH